jgi:hypothetical protein
MTAWGSLHAALVFDVFRHLPLSLAAGRLTSIMADKK